MKVLHLHEVGGDAATVALHPQVTVIRGLADDRRAWLVDALAKISSGSVAAEGELDAHGIRFPLDGATLRLLGLDSPVAAVVRAADLPGHDPRAADAAAAKDRAAARRRALTDEITRHRAALGAAMAEREAATSELEEVRRGEGSAREAVAAGEAARHRAEAEEVTARADRTAAEQALADAILARDIADEARGAAAQRHETARDHHREAMAAASRAAAAVEEATSVAANDPTDTLSEARDQLSQAEQAAGELDPEHDSSPINTQMAELEGRRGELDRLRDALGPSSAAPVADALDRLLAASDEAPPVVAALALADTWRDLHQQIGGLDAGVSPDEQYAEERVAMARRAMAEAEADFNQPVLTPDQIAKVEAAHNTVLEAQDRTEGRFGGARSRKKLDETRSEERRILERLGFSTYADYMMSSSSRGVGSANRAILETAKAQFAAASEELAQLPGAAERARRRAELLQRRDAVAPRVADLIGHEPTGPEAEDELRQLREPIAPRESALNMLASRLADVGIVVGPPPHDADDVVLLARSYLAEQQESETRRNEVDGAIQDLDVAIGRLRDARQRGATELPELPDLPPLAQPVPADADPDADARAVTLREVRWAEVEAARKAVSEAEAAVARHRDASDQLTILQMDLEHATVTETDAAAAVAATEAELALADGPALAEARAAVDAAEAALVRARVREKEAGDRASAAGGDSGVAALLAAAEERVRAAESAVTGAAASEQSTATELATADAEHSAAKLALEEATAAAEGRDRDGLVDEIDWELLSRLAAVRSVGLAGSVPLVLDDPFTALEDDELTRVLDRVVQLAGAVQVVLVTDRPVVADWAARAGAERAAVVAA